MCSCEWYHLDCSLSFLTVQPEKKTKKPLDFIAILSAIEKYLKLWKYAVARFFSKTQLKHKLKQLVEETFCCCSKCLECFWPLLLLEPRGERPAALLCLRKVPAGRLACLRYIKKCCELLNTALSVYFNWYENNKPETRLHFYPGCTIWNQKKLQRMMWGSDWTVQKFWFSFSQRETRRHLNICPSGGILLQQFVMNYDPFFI